MGRGGGCGKGGEAAAAAAAAGKAGAVKYISHQFPQVFSSSRVSEGTLGSFSVRFCGVFVLPCHAVLLPGGAFGTLLSAAAAAAAAASSSKQQQGQQLSSIFHASSPVSQF